MVHGCSFKELNVYLQDLLAENINTDVDAAIKEFCDAVYGKAADDIIAYLKDSYAAGLKDPGYFRYYNDPRVMRRVVHSPENLIRWQKDFDRMEKKVKDDPRALFNVRRARINLDAVTVLCYPECAKYDPEFAEALPLDTLYKRYCKYVRDDARVQFRSLGKNSEMEKGHVQSFITAVRMAYEFNRRKQSYPEELIAKYGKENLVTLMPCQIRRPPAMWDKNTACGYAVRIPIPKRGSTLVVQEIRVGEKNGLPWNTVSMHEIRRPMLRRDELAKVDDQYRLFRVGRTKLSESGQIQLATLPEHKGQLGRSARFFLGSHYDPANPNRKFDIYLSVKDGGDGKSLLVDRLVLAKVK